MNSTIIINVFATFAVPLLVSGFCVGKKDILFVFCFERILRRCGPREEAKLNSSDADDATAENKIEVMRADQVPSIDNMGEGCRVRILSPPEDAGRNEVYELRFSPGGLLDSQPHRRGAREHLTVVEGYVVVTSGHTTEELNAGDTARYNADIAHSISAPDGPARAFLVVQDA